MGLKTSHIVFATPFNLGASAFVVANDAPTDIKGWASAAEDAGSNVFVCDGTADDVQIQAALGSLETRNSGSILLSEGTFNISTVVTITGKGIGIYGCNVGEVTSGGLTGIGTRLKAAGSNNIFRLGITAGARPERIRISNIFFDGNDVGANGLQIDCAIGTILDNLVFRNFTNAGILGATSVIADWIAGFYANKITATTVNLIPLVTDSGMLEDIWFNECYINFFNVGDATHLWHEIYDVKLIGTTHERMTYYGVSAYSLTSSLQISNIHFNSTGDAHICYIQDCDNGRIDGISITHSGTGAAIDKYGLALVNVKNMTVVNAQITSRATLGIAILYCGIYLQGGYRVNIMGGNIWNTGRAAIMIWGSTRCLVDGVACYNTGQGTYATRYAIDVYGDGSNESTYNRFANIRSVEDATNKVHYNIAFDANSDYNEVHDCDFSGAATSPVLDSGTGNNITGNIGYVTENSGTATVLNGQTTIVVAHGLATTPTRVFITRSSSSTNSITAYWVSTLTSTNFTISVNADPGASGASFDWHAQIGER